MGDGLVRGRTGAHASENTKTGRAQPVLPAYPALSSDVEGPNRFQSPDAARHSGDRGNSATQTTELTHIFVFVRARPLPGKHPVVAGLDPATFVFLCAIPGSLLARGFRLSKLRLLKLNLGAGFFELGLDLVGLVLVDAFLDRLGRALDQVLGLLEAEAGERTHLLDDLDLLVAHGGKNDRELGLLLDRRCRGSGRAGGDRDGSRG